MSPNRIHALPDPRRSIFVRLSHRLVLAAILASLAACGAGVLHSDGRLARVSPKDFIGYKPEQIAVGIDIDTRVPISLNRAPDLVVAVMPVDHDAWEPIGARLRMRPLNVAGKKPDAAAGERLRAWSEAPPGRYRLPYVLTDESAAELVQLQQKFDALLKQYPAGSGKGGALRIRADAYHMIDLAQARPEDEMRTWLQLDLAEGPFILWDGRIARMR